MEIRHFISKEKERQYGTIPFEVPENVEKITVSYSYYQPTSGLMGDVKPSNTIDIGLMDEKGTFLGWSGSAHPSVFVGEFSSSNGYLCEKIHSGTWRIIVGAYHVMPEGVTVVYQVDFQYRRTRLLVGDLHVHSNASDGKFDIYTLGKMAKEKGLDFMGIANHNNYAENFFLPHEQDFTFVPAVEWTHYNGHMNFFGVKAPFENSFIANNEEQLLALVNHARSQGAVISVNHPKDYFCPYLWKSLDAFDMVEIWNGPMQKRNRDAIDWWTGLLKQGRRLPAVGGSDYHRPRSTAFLGNPVTGVITRSPGEEEIVDALRKGHAFISRGVKGPRVVLRYGKALMGDETEYHADIPLTVKTAHLGHSRVVLVTDRTERTVTLSPAGEVDIPSCRFAYVKILTGPLVEAVSNPIYFRRS